MLKFRIQHLLAVKSSRDGKNITLDDLSRATGISRPALYKMNADPKYNPSKEVMEKLVNYFQCTFDDLFDRTTKFTFDLQAAFPADDDLSSMVMALLTVANDLTFLKKLQIYHDLSEGSGAQKEVSAGVQSFIFFLTIGFLMEGLNIFRTIENNKVAQELFLKLDKGGKKSFEFLQKKLDGNGLALKKMRNQVGFHYNDQKCYLNALKSIKQKMGDFIVGPTAAETRFLVADDIRSEVLRSHIDFDNIGSKVEQDKMRRVVEGLGHINTFCQSFLLVYIDYRKVQLNAV